MDVSSRFPILHFPQLPTRKTPRPGQHGIRFLTLKTSVRVDATLHASAVDEDEWPQYGLRQCLKQAENIIVYSPRKQASSESSKEGKRKMKDIGSLASETISAARGKHESACLWTQDSVSETSGTGDGGNNSGVPSDRVMDDKDKTIVVTALVVLLDALREPVPRAKVEWDPKYIHFSRKFGKLDLRPLPMDICNTGLLEMKKPSRCKSPQRL